MKEIVYSLISGALAGGIVGQISAIYITNTLTSKRETANWLRNEKHRVFCELMRATSAVVTRCEQGDIENWPEEIRVLSQRVHLLYPGGHAPEKISDSLEELFQLVLKKKLGRVKDVTDWRHKMRDETRRLREYFADTLIS